MTLRRRGTFAVLALALAWMLFARGRNDASVDAADPSPPTAVLRDIAATDSGGLSWTSYTTAGRAVRRAAGGGTVQREQRRPLRRHRDRRLEAPDRARQDHHRRVRLPAGMGSAAEGQASRFNPRVEFRGADGKAAVAARYDNDRGRQFDELCDKHYLPGELDGVR